MRSTNRTLILARHLLWREQKVSISFLQDKFMYKTTKWSPELFQMDDQLCWFCFICSIWHCYHKSTVDRLRLKLFSDTESLPQQPLCQRGKIVSSGIHWERLPMCLPRNERRGTLQRFLYHQCNENQLTLDQEGPTSFIILKSHPWIAR